MPATVDACGGSCVRIAWMSWALEPDSEMKLDYFKEEEIDANDYRTT